MRQVKSRRVRCDDHRARTRVKGRVSLERRREERSGEKREALRRERERDRDQDSLSRSWSVLGGKSKGVRTRAEVSTRADGLRRPVQVPKRARRPVELG